MSGIELLSAVPLLRLAPVTPLTPAETAPVVRDAVRGGWGPPAPGECHLWMTPVRRRPEWQAHLDPEERKRLDTLSVPSARDTFVTSRALQRLIGAGYLGVPADSVVVNRDCGYCGGLRHGRPRYSDTSVDYSVSHTRDWVLMAVVGTGTVGADIEAFATDRDTVGLTKVVLTAREKEMFAALPEDERAARFFVAWTRKEAAMKLTGLGLRAAPNQLDVSGPMLSVGKVPAWIATPVHLYDLPAPPGHASALASTAPVTVLREFELSEFELSDIGVSDFGLSGPVVEG